MIVAITHSITKRTNHLYVSLCLAYACDIKQTLDFITLKKFIDVCYSISEIPPDSFFDCKSQ